MMAFILLDETLVAGSSWRWNERARFWPRRPATVQAEGGWDVTSFCDPKTNVAGELPINNWANSNDIQTIGNINYAPFADNAAFFQKYYQDMLVINGMDAQTNSHTAGVVHSWSGRISEGYPSLTALFSAQYGPNLPISYINNGGYADTGGLTRYTRLDNLNGIGNVIFPNINLGDTSENYLPASDFSLVEQARMQRLTALNTQSNLTARQSLNRSNYQSAINNSSILTDFAREIRRAGNVQQSVTQGDFYSTLRRQAQLALLAMNAGVSISADLVQHGFDTHDNHDASHTLALTELTQSIDYLQLLHQNHIT